MSLPGHLPGACNVAILNPNASTNAPDAASYAIPVRIAASESRGVVATSALEMYDPKECPTCAIFEGVPLMSPVYLPDRRNIVSSRNIASWVRAWGSSYPGTLFHISRLDEYGIE